MLPVIHNTWRRGETGYFDPMLEAKLDGKRYSEFVEALRSENLVIMQRDKKGSLEREGYIGIFEFGDLEIGKDGSIKLTLLSRYN
jgi:hypothetical protein